MTKAELREKLLGGAVMDDLFAFRNGQDCEIFKAARFEQGDDIIYILDIALNLIPVTEPANGPEDVEEIEVLCEEIVPEPQTATPPPRTPKKKRKKRRRK